MSTIRLVRGSLPLWLALAVVAVLLPFAQEAQANHGSRTLEATPETNSRPINQEQELTATLSSAATQGTGAINIDFEMESGANDPDGATSNSPQTPDKTCSIPAGETACTVSYIGDEPGRDLWRVWIDHDGLNSTSESDKAEGRDESTDPGDGDPCNQIIAGVPNPDEPDCTDVIEITWQGTVFPGSIDCDDEKGPDTERAFNPSGGGEASNESTTCRVFDQNGNPLNDANPNNGSTRDATTLYGENKDGANDPDNGESYDTPDYTCNTPTSGNGPYNQCTMNITQSELQVGTAEICFWAVGENEGTVQNAGEQHCIQEGEPTGENQQSTGADSPNDLADQTEVTWAEREARSLDVEADTQTLAVGAERTLTATVYDQFGDTFQGETEVDFEWFVGSPADQTNENSDGNSPETPDEGCTTNNSSTCSVTYTTTQAGRDLICGWIGTTPAMTLSAKNESGTCNGEKRVDDDDTEGSADAPDPVDDRIDVVSTVWKNDPEATVVECTPEFTSRLVRRQHRITCKASTSEPDSAIANTEIDIEATGKNDPDNGNTPITPDLSCTTGQDGTCVVTHGGGNATSKTGTTQYRAWIDADYFDGTAEADADEKRNEQTGPGATAEPDNTDVVQIKWLSGARKISLKTSKQRPNAGSGEFDLFGRIDAVAGKACEAGMTVVIYSRPADTNKPFKKRFTTVSESDGTYRSEDVTLNQATDFKSAANKKGPCVRAVSNIVTVRPK